MVGAGGLGTAAEWAGHASRRRGRRQRSQHLCPGHARVRVQVLGQRAVVGAGRVRPEEAARPVVAALLLATRRGAQHSRLPRHDANLELVVFAHLLDP